MKLSSPMRRAIVLMIVFVGAILCVVFAIFKRPVIYKIADNYTGWVVMKYDDPSCPLLEIQNTFVIIPISASGEGCTSSPLQAGWRVTFYEYVDGKKVMRHLRQSGWGGGGEIWGGFYMVEKHSGSFFVGSEKELKESWALRPR